MRVLHIITDLQTAGAQTVVMNYLRCLHNDKDVLLTVLVLGCPRNTDFEIECSNNGYNVKFLNYKETATPYLFKPLINWLRLQLLLFNFLRRNKFDIIHTHVTPIIPYTLFPIWLCRPEKYFHTLHSDPDAIKPSFQKWARFAFHRMGVIPICVTEYQRTKAEQVYRLSNPVVIHNGLDFRIYQKIIDQYALRKQLGIEESLFVIGFVGRLNKIKNIPFLLAVYSEYLKSNPKSILLIIGEGEERSNLETIVKDNKLNNCVRFLGRRNDVATLYKAMDLFMLTSFHESSSIVTVEAQLSGVRCVVSDNIPDSVVVSTKIRRLSLEDSISHWVEAMADTSNSNTPAIDINEYNIDNTIFKLKKIYSSEQD